MIAQVPIRVLAPRARYVTLRPYTALHATMIPNLGLRLVFPAALARAVVLAVTNPLFRATMLPRAGGIVLVTRGGFHHRYCTNVFVSLVRFHVSILVCTANVSAHYVSDLLFVAPKPAIRRMRRRPTRLWAPLLARLLCASPRRHPIRKRVVLHVAAETIALEVRERLGVGTHALFVARIRAQPRAVRVLGLALYANRPWRIRSTNFQCSARQGRDVGCVVVAARVAMPVTRWHMVLVTEDGSVSISW